MAGITQRAWEEIEVLYQRGIKRYFDVAALQIFPQTVKRAVKATRVLPRRACGARGDGRKPIYLTEITWPASKGRTRGDQVPAPGDADAGWPPSSARCTRAMACAGAALGVGKVFWYTWSSPYGRGGSIFNYAGLQRFDDTQLRARSPRWARTSGARDASRAARRRSPASASSASSGSRARVDLLGGALPGEAARRARGPPPARRSRSAPAAEQEGVREARPDRPGRRAGRRRRTPRAAPRGRRPRPACRPPSPRRTAARSPRRATAWRRRRRPRRARAGRPSGT